MVGQGPFRGVYGLQGLKSAHKHPVAPAVQRQIVPAAPQQLLPQVGVGVDKAGDDRPVPAVHPG
ncbi:hypothetical protein SDC9_189295 [bioreactor metagenome]|uniref:Uncharacterized protein n=1 Tax=bioreactor metagenome TaxID=1076179 RepID=A0A645HSB7_9ZZZZ